MYQGEVVQGSEGNKCYSETQQNSSRNSFITIYKSFVRLYLDYCDMIYDQPNNEIFAQKFERFQYNAALAITGAIKGTSQC